MTAAEIDFQATARTKARYDRLAPIYDLMEALIERFTFSRWRKLLWSQVPGGKVLEVGVGTGKNMPYYPQDSQITAIDLSDKMLARARRRAEQEGLHMDLPLMDVQALRFADNTFDSVVASFVFCSVPDPVRGLMEVRRVLKPDGRVVLLEHMRAENGLAGVLMDLLNPFVVRITGANINRYTVENVKKAGLEIEKVKRLSALGIVKLIIARPGEN